MRKLVRNISFVTIVLLMFACQNQDNKIIVLKENGSWCWFQDERAIISNNQLIFGTVSDRYGKNGEAVDGDINVTTFDLESKTNLGTFILQKKSLADDHNAPAFLTLPNKQTIAVYAQHNLDSLIRYRFSAKNSSLEWGSENSVKGFGNLSYSNVFYLQEENNGKGRILDFYRGKDKCPHYVFSDDMGESWQSGEKMISFEMVWSYVKYQSDGKSKIHFITTESHPKFWQNSIYHGYFENGKVYKSDGKLICDLKDRAIHPTEATRVFQGDSENNAWTVDIHLDKKGMPYIAYSVGKDVDHIQYRYAKWDGKTWNDYFLAFAGRALYEIEYSYSGLVALDPDNPDVVYISTDVDPVSETPLISEVDNTRHFEIFKGSTLDSGETWKWRAITKNSCYDNVRPIMPKGNEKYKVVLWLRGSIKSYKDYNFDVVGIVNPE